jgi:putative transposase
MGEAGRHRHRREAWCHDAGISTCEGTREGESGTSPRQRDLEVGLGFFRAGARPALEVVRFVDTHKGRFGIEPICNVLQFAPSTYYAVKAHVPSQRACRDEELKKEIRRVHRASNDVYGSRKVWIQLTREDIDVGRDRVRRLMREMELKGVRRGGNRKVVTTRRDENATLPPDLVERDFTATEPDTKWVSDFTYVPTASGMVYVAFVVDLFSRMIVGWSVSTSMTTNFVLDALEMALWLRDGGASGLVHHSDRGSQYTAIAYSERLAAAGIQPSVGSKGDSYDNAVAETTIGLYKTELIHRLGNWRDAVHVEMETLNYVDWFNTERIHGFCDDLSPRQFEMREAS